MKKEMCFSKNIDARDLTSNDLMFKLSKSWWLERMFQEAVLYLLIYLLYNSFLSFMLIDSIGDSNGKLLAVCNF